MVSPSIIIRRNPQFHPGPTSGTLLLNGCPSLITLEPPWKFNLPGVSCIPEGTYDTEIFTHQTYGRTLHIPDVPGRSDIIFHTGNSLSDTAGCILLGSGFSSANVSGQPYAIINSCRAMDLFSRWLESCKSNPSLLVCS